MVSGDLAADARFHLNGIDGSTGNYLVPELEAGTVSTIALGERLSREVLDELKAKYLQVSMDHLGVVAEVDPNDLAQAGWGVIFSHDADPRIHEALTPLLEHRRALAGSKDERFYREYTGADGYRPGESNVEFLVRHGVAPGQPANPERMPYYLMIVGDSEEIPFRFQYQLDVIYAVGRIWFDDVEGYAHYARSAVAAETRPVPGERSAVFFGARNNDDRATTLSADHLIAPLAERLAGQIEGWTVDSVVAEAATKERAGRLLGAETPALLFSATHGMGFPSRDPRQLPHQGALLCQDWPGRVEWRKAIPEDFYFSGDDLSQEAGAANLIALLFACYGAGTPKTDDFEQAVDASKEIAPHSFVGRLPMRLLGHPKGGALAVVGHVERAWSFSFTWPRAGEQLDVFHSMLRQLLQGFPVGAAMEFFNIRYAALTTELEAEKESIDYGKIPDPVGLSGLWTAKNDARNYVIIGDPAVRFQAEV